MRHRVHPRDGPADFKAHPSSRMSGTPSRRTNESGSSPSGSSTRKAGRLCPQATVTGSMTVSSSSCSRLMPGLAARAFGRDWMAPMVRQTMLRPWFPTRERFTSLLRPSRPHGRCLALIPVGPRVLGLLVLAKTSIITLLATLHSMRSCTMKAILS